MQPVFQKFRMCAGVWANKSWEQKQHKPECSKNYLVIIFILSYYHSGPKQDERNKAVYQRRIRKHREGGKIKGEENFSIINHACIQPGQTGAKHFKKPSSGLADKITAREKPQNDKPCPPRNENSQSVPVPFFNYQKRIACA